MNAVEKIISDCHKAEERSAELADKLDSLESAFDELLFSGATDQNHPAGLKSLVQASEISTIPVSTLKDWFVKKPKQFNFVIRACVLIINES